MRTLAAVAITGACLLAGIGFSGSYTTLATLAHDHGFGWFAHVFPVGVDVGIVVLLAVDLHLIRRGTPWPVLRLLAHTFTVATVAFNASAAGSPTADPVGAAMHAVIPLCFVAAVEARRRLVIRITRLEAGHVVDRVPLHRWLLAPGPTWCLYRRMRLWGISYPDAVARQRDLTVYSELLEREHGSVSKAPADLRLPLTMAPYGLTVDEALALPDRAREQAEQRREAAAQRDAERRARAAQRAADAEVARLRTDAAVVAARCEVDAESSAVEARARASRVAAEAAADAEARAALVAAQAAERAAVEERRAVETATTAEARRRASEADAAAVETRRRASEVERAAAETERRAAEERGAAQRAERDAALARQAAAEADKRASEARAAAVETRARTAEMELRALEMEDAARLTPRERTVRKVARMVLAEAFGDAERLPLERITDALAVSVSTASQYRAEAIDLIQQGYRPTAERTGQ